MSRYGLMIWALVLSTGPYVASKTSQVAIDRKQAPAATNKPVDPDASAANSGVISEMVQVRGLRLRATSGKRAAISIFEENRKGQLRPSPRFNVQASLCNKMAWEQDFLVWTSIDSVVAPAVRDIATLKADPTDGSFSWGWMGELKDLRSTPVYHLPQGDCRTVHVGRFDLAPMMKTFDMPETLWVWAIRVNLHVAGRDGKEVGTGQVIVRVEPRSGRVRDVSEKEMRVILGFEGGEPISRVPDH